MALYKALLNLLTIKGHTTQHIRVAIIEMIYDHALISLPNAALMPLSEHAGDNMH